MREAFFFVSMGEKRIHGASQDLEQFLRKVYSSCREDLVLKSSGHITKKPYRANSFCVDGKIWSQIILHEQNFRDPASYAFGIIPAFKSSRTVSQTVLHRPKSRFALFLCRWEDLNLTGSVHLVDIVSLLRRKIPHKVFKSSCQKLLRILCRWEDLNFRPSLYE